jgi:exopolysaccharide biosynthesis polyprenyl glycosylphosphotransferase
MRRKYDMLLKGMKLLIPFWNIIIFCYVWILYYNERTYTEFWLETLAISVFIYVIIYAAFGRLYNAFKIGTYKISELVFSQILAFGIADLCMYLVCCIMHRGIVSILPGFWAFVIQFIGSVVFIVLAKHYFIKYIPPQKSLLIFSGNEADVASFEKKIEKKLSHMFAIEERFGDDSNIEEILKSVDRYNTVIFFQPNEDMRVKVLAKCLKGGKNIYITPNIDDIFLTNFENRHIIDTPLLKANTEGEEYMGKRVFDIIFSSILLVIFSPFMLIIAVAIKLEDHGPVFYRQKRVTKDGRVFEILKFRSMIPDAEKDGVKPATTGDNRITHVGKVIRATRLDECPQLINIFKGDMSIVGPRPERVEHVEKYTAALPEFAYRLRVRGGLTGYAQIYGKYNTSAEDKLKMDLMYIERQSFLLDLQLIFLTVKIMFIPESTEGFN